MRSKLFASLLLAASCYAADVSAGVEIAPPPQPPVFIESSPMPGFGYVWVAGYWYPVNGKYVWHEGYWTRPPYPGAYWIGPRYDGARYYAGYWNGDQGRLEHDHASDRRPDRDFRAKK
jgi:hypothetical protein